MLGFVPRVGGVARVRVHERRDGEGAAERRALAEFEPFDGLGEPLGEARREIPVAFVERKGRELRETMRLRGRHRHRAQHLPLLQPVAGFRVAVLDAQRGTLEVARHRAVRAAHSVELVRPGGVLAHAVDAFGADHRSEQRSIGGE